MAAIGVDFYATSRDAVPNGYPKEILAGVIDARSSAAHRMALRQLDGGLSRRIATLRARLLELEALLAYDIDFPEEDDGPVPRQRIAQATDELLDSLGALLATGERTGYAYSDDLSPEKILKAAGVAACIAAGPAQVETMPLQELCQRHAGVAKGKPQVKPTFKRRP